MYVQNFCRNVLKTIFLANCVERFLNIMMKLMNGFKSDTYEVHRIDQIHDLTWPLNSMWVVEFVNLLILDCITNQ